MSTAEHRKLAGHQSALCAVLTISDTRTPDTDEGGKLIKNALVAAGHSVRFYAIVKDEPAQIETQLKSWLTSPRPVRSGTERGQVGGNAANAGEGSSIQVILCTGGTGIARRDTTIEVVERLLDKKLDGFGELFRMLSYEEVGSAAMLSRAAAGLVGETLIFAMPGSPTAVQLALEKLIIPELPHLIWERKR